MMKKRLKAALSRFSRDTEGYVNVESIIVMPILLWLFGVGWVYFDAFHQQSVNQKANYVIADMISRETNGINGAYVDGAFDLLTTLTKSDDALTDMRIAVVQYDADKDSWSVVWSRQRGSTLRGRSNNLSDADMATYRTMLPAGMDNEQLLIVETWEDWEPAFDVGIGAFDIRTYSFTSPRYAPQIPYVRGNLNS
ncbi:TadE/TadG family type IV pilus assembly protein [Sagittula salina]|uniref:Flp pilus assembly protein TadG n=1 Tax=Sagittula salina TaxID=2820268 RepID=A0A940S1X2_9RHOB|nr:hypothetical protein [Sagittula salina]MBP0481399.1 hypothetical protein [Sagittula salina]